MTSESERTTRQERIDPKLHASGWIVTPYHPAKPLSGYSNHAVAEYPTANGPADYALVVDGVILGIVEARKLTVIPSGVLVQAERYSEGVAECKLNYSGFRVPFLYSTNGQTVRLHDVRDAQNLSRQIQTFHSPTVLRELFARSNEGHIWLADHPPEHTRLHDYQKAANTEVENAIIAGKRQMLVAMATGTGKTFTAVNQCYRLLDLLFADECHRGYTSAEQSIRRAVLDHYDSIKVGLTATPASHTKAYFKDVVFRYTYDQAVREGHLVDWELLGRGTRKGDKYPDKSHFTVFDCFNGTLKSDFTASMKLLRDRDFQDLLENYPRSQRTFLRATEDVDEVSSEHLIRDGLGREHKPEDYLEMFSRFVRENPAQIEAFQILLNRPADWSTMALKELREKLITAPERFTLEALQKAHEARYSKSLVANLSIDRDDFDVLPAFEGAEGWGKANTVFMGSLDQLLQEINMAIAA